jgi:hypothetical protein
MAQHEPDGGACSTGCSDPDRTVKVAERAAAEAVRYLMHRCRVDWHEVAVECWIGGH